MCFWAGYWKGPDFGWDHQLCAVLAEPSWGKPQIKNPYNGAKNVALQTVPGHNVQIIFRTCFFSSFPWGLPPWAQFCMGLDWTVMAFMTMHKYETTNSFSPTTIMVKLILWCLKMLCVKMVLFQKMGGMFQEALAMPGPVLSQASPAPSQAIIETTSTTPFSLQGQGAISFSQVGMFFSHTLLNHTTCCKYPNISAI